MPFPAIVVGPRHRRAAAAVAATFVLVTGVVGGVLLLAWPAAPVHVHVRWKSGTTDAERVRLEHQFQLAKGVNTEGTTWEYQLQNPSTANVRTIVQHAQVDDTSHLNRIRYRPEFAQDRGRQILVYSVASGAIGAILAVILAVGPLRDVSFLFDSRGLKPQLYYGRRDSVELNPPRDRRAIAAAVAGGVLWTLAMMFAGATPWSAAAALLIVHGGGYVAGSLLVATLDGWALAAIRTIAGLLLTTFAFLLSLVLSLPWFVGPAATVVAAVLIHRGRAFALPSATVRLRWDDAGAAAGAAILLSPILLSYVYMAPGRFPPVFINVDIAYFLGQVHALVAAERYPPGSLSNAGFLATYHYGTQAMAALIARSSGLLPHHALFLIVLPMLAVGVAAAGVAAARLVAPRVPRSLAVPLLLVSTPALSTSLWAALAPQWWAAARAGQVSLDRVLGDYSLWGILSNGGQNVGGDFIVLASIAGIAAARTWGWALPAFLVGSAILVKVPVGIALVAGFALVEAWHAIAARRLRARPPLLMVGAVFVVTVVAFFATSYESQYRVEPYLLYHVGEVTRSGDAPGVVADLLWLLLPAAIVLTPGLRDSARRSGSLLLMAAAAILVVNTTRLGSDGGGSGSNWMQVLHPVPFFLHAFALSLASAAWPRIGPARRAAFLLAVAVSIVPVVTAAARYSVALLRNPANGNEFVDNRTIAEALAAIPTSGTIVTNDLRYPAQNFSRDDRQMQIPALFGHQAFAVNYAYESGEPMRRELQRLLQQPEWSDTIPQVARAFGWTHFLVRKDYIHPSPVPLPQIFENESYAVFRFVP